LRLFCFPYAGGGTAAYFPWAKLLSPNIELYAVRLPGRESRMREASYLRIEPLVEDMAEVLSSYFDRPFVFFGHSMGALLAFELIRYLRRQNAQQPLHLVASGHRAPQLPDPYPPLYQLPDDEFIRQMDERYSGIPKVILENPELLAMFLPVMRADLTILDTYQYVEEPPLACPISVFGGDNDPSVNDDELSAWRSQTQSAFRLKLFDGDHFYLQGAQSQVVQAITQELSHYLAR
jgi:medium-chain acyl-[acyl-carrier-protein] hydrolase